MVRTSSVCIVFSLSEAGAPQEVPARCQVCEDAVGVPWVPFLLDCDLSLVSDLIEQIPQSEIVDPAATDWAHDALSAGIEEPDMLVHDIGVLRVVNVLKVDIVEEGGVAPDDLNWVHSRVVEVARVEAEPGDLFREVFCDTVELVFELDVAAGVRGENRTDAIPFSRKFRDGMDIGDHAIPRRLFETGSPTGVSSCIVALVVAPVHHGEVRRFETLTGMVFGPWQ